MFVLVFGVYCLVFSRRLNSFDMHRFRYGFVGGRKCRLKVRFFGKIESVCAWCWMLGVEGRGAESGVWGWGLDIRCRMLDIGCWILDVGCSNVGCWMLNVGCWLLDVRCWLLAVGFWLLVVGFWLLVVDC